MKRVLVVDDERDVADALGELLGERYTTAVAYDGAEALGLLEAGGVDLVVLDLMMPVMSGQALMAELQSRGITVPVIFASAAADLPAQARRSSANDFIAKPFDLDELEGKIARLLGPGGEGGPSPGAGAEETQWSSGSEGGEDASAPGASSTRHRSTSPPGLAPARTVHRRNVSQARAVEEDPSPQRHERRDTDCAARPHATSERRAAAHWCSSWKKDSAAEAIRAQIRPDVAIEWPRA